MYSTNMMQNSFDENELLAGNKAEHRKLLEIQLSLMSSDIASTIDPFVLQLAATPGRIFIKDAVMEKACRRVNKPYRFWLFNDCFAYGTAVGGGRYQFVKKVDLATCSIADFPSIFYENAMAISDAGKTFVAFSNSRNTQQEWVYLVTKAIVKLRCSPTSMARFHSQKKSVLSGDTQVSTRRNDWGIDVHEETPQSIYAVHINDSAITPLTCTTATNCALCDQLFGSFKQRFECSDCCTSVCAICSFQHSAQGDSKRTCDDCWMPTPDSEEDILRYKQAENDSNQACSPHRPSDGGDFAASSAASLGALGTSLLTKMTPIAQAVKHAVRFSSSPPPPLPLPPPPSALTIVKPTPPPKPVRTPSTLSTLAQTASHKTHTSSQQHSTSSVSSSTSHTSYTSSTSTSSSSSSSYSSSSVEGRSFSEQSSSSSSSSYEHHTTGMDGTTHHKEHSHAALSTARHGYDAEDEWQAPVFVPQITDCHRLQAPLIHAAVLLPAPTPTPSRKDVSQALRSPPLTPSVRRPLPSPPTPAPAHTPRVAVRHSDNLDAIDDDSPREPEPELEPQSNTLEGYESDVIDSTHCAAERDSQGGRSHDSNTKEVKRELKFFDPRSTYASSTNVSAFTSNPTQIENILDWQIVVRVAPAKKSSVVAKRINQFTSPSSAKSSRNSAVQKKGPALGYAPHSGTSKTLSDGPSEAVGAANSRLGPGSISSSQTVDNSGDRGKDGGGGMNGVLKVTPSTPSPSPSWQTESKVKQKAIPVVKTHQITADTPLPLKVAHREGTIMIEKSQSQPALGGDKVTCKSSTSSASLNKKAFPNTCSAYEKKKNSQNSSLIVTSVEAAPVPSDSEITPSAASSAMSTPSSSDCTPSSVKQKHSYTPNNVTSYIPNVVLPPALDADTKKDAYTQNTVSPPPPAPSPSPTPAVDAKKHSYTPNNVTSYIPNVVLPPAPAVDVKEHTDSPIFVIPPSPTPSPSPTPAVDAKKHSYTPNNVTSYIPNVVLPPAPAGDAKKLSCAQNTVSPPPPAPSPSSTPAVDAKKHSYTPNNVTSYIPNNSLTPVPESKKYSHHSDSSDKKSVSGLPGSVVPHVAAVGRGKQSGPKFSSLDAVAKYDISVCAGQGQGQGQQACDSNSDDIPGAGCGGCAVRGDEAGTCEVKGTGVGAGRAA